MQRQWNDVQPGQICGYCDENLYFSGCSAPSCDGWGCPDCGTGCDLDFSDEDGICATEIKDHREEGHPGKYRKTDFLIDGEPVYLCECQVYIVWTESEEGYGPRELTGFEVTRLRQTSLPDVSAL